MRIDLMMQVVGEVRPSVIMIAVRPEKMGLNLLRSIFGPRDLSPSAKIRPSLVLITSESVP